mgnify:CR=1 FL=1
MVISTEVFKIGIFLSTLLLGTGADRAECFKGWTLGDSLKKAAAPAVLYAIQNILNQEAYSNLDEMSFNLMNQTKTLSSALFCYLILGKPQSAVQVMALLMLLAAAIVLNVEYCSLHNGIPGAAVLFNALGLPACNPGEATETSKIASDVYTTGLMCVLAASTISGLSSALTQKSTQGRNSYLLSAELAVYGIAFLVVRLLVLEKSFNSLGLDMFANWNLITTIPVVVNAFGGIWIGQILKYADAVSKGFALIAGIIVTGLVKWFFQGEPLEQKTWVALVLVACSIYLHTSYPPAAPKSKSKIA